MKTFLVTVLLVFAVLPGCGQARSDRETLIRDILAASGIRHKTDRVAIEVREHFTPILQEMAGQPAEAFRTLADQTFAGDSLYTLVEQYWMARATNVDQLQAVHNHLTSPTATRLQKLEQEALQPEAFQQIAEYTKRVQQDSSLRQRAELMMVTGRDATQTTIRFLGSLTEQVFLLLNAQSPASQQMTAKDVHTIVDNMKAGMQDYYRMSMLGFYAYAYRTVPVEELQRYVAFYTDTDEGKWFRTMADAAYADACNRASQLFMQRLRNTYAGMMQEAQSSEMPQEMRPVPAQQEKGELEKLRKNLQQQSNGGKIIGMIEATVNSVKWYGYLNAEDNHNGTITILALNNELEPLEQAEVTFSFKGTGVYPIEKQFAGVFRVTAAERKVVSEFYSRGAAADRVTITSYDKQSNMIDGHMEFTAYGKDGEVTFKSQPFSVRIR